MLADLDISLGCGYASRAISAHTKVELYSSELAPLIVSTWAFGFTFNVFVSGAIAGRLWWMGRTTASMTATSNNRFLTSIYIFVESSAINAVCSVAVFAPYVSNNPVAVTRLDFASQLTVCLYIIPSFPRIKTKTHITLAGIGTTVDHRVGWAN